MSVDQVSGGRFDMGRVVTATFASVQKHAAILLPASLVYLALTQGVTYFGMSSIDPARLIFSPIYWIILVITLIGGFILQAFVIHVVVDGHRGNTPTIGNSLSAAVKSFIPLLVTGILTVLGAYLGLFLLIVPGVILFVMWSVAVPVVVVEGAGPIAALGRSRALTKGSRWAIFGLCLVALILVSVISFAIYGFNLAAMSTATQNPSVVRIIASILIGTITTVLMYAGIAAIYSELRMVKEGVANDQLAKVFE
jgi:uncharacterized membrane protein